MLVSMNATTTTMELWWDNLPQFIVSFDFISN